MHILPLLPYPNLLLSPQWKSTFCPNLHSLSRRLINSICNATSPSKSVRRFCKMAKEALQSFQSARSIKGLSTKANTAEKSVQTARQMDRAWSITMTDLAMGSSGTLITPVGSGC